MTKQDAIELLRELSNFVATPPETDEAVNMAIEALSENKRTDKHTETHAYDCISRQDAIDGLEHEAEMLKRVLDNVEVVGQEREKFAWGLGLVECFIEDIKQLPSKEIINMKSVFNLSEDAERGEEK